MAKVFGTDGIRGLANVEPITPETALRLGAALGSVLKRRHARPAVVIGRDTRLSGPMLEGALIAGLCSSGTDVHSAGVIPTPAIAFLTRALQAGAGVVVSASHNPFPDNGIKLFGADGFKLSDDQEAEMEAALSEGVAARATGADIGRLLIESYGGEKYVAGLLQHLPSHTPCSSVRVILDCAHGAASTVAPVLFERTGAQVEVIGASPDGTNINVDSGALHPGSLQCAVRARGDCIGIAFDGDADRVLLVDEAGDLVDGDDVLGILATDAVNRGVLRERTVVGTVMTNLGLERMLHELGVDLVRTAVGDRYVVEEMRRRSAQFGGESSGHIILLDQSTTGDGPLAALNIVESMARSGKPLRALRQAVSKCPQVLLNVKTPRRVDLATLPTVKQAIADAEAALHDRGRVLVRCSGTEPLVRVMVEGYEADEVQRHAERIAAVVREAVA